MAVNLPWNPSASEWAVVMLRFLSVSVLVLSVVPFFLRFLSQNYRLSDLPARGGEKVEEREREEEEGGRN